MILSNRRIQVTLTVMLAVTLICVGLVACKVTDLKLDVKEIEIPVKRVSDI